MLKRMQYFLGRPIKINPNLSVIAVRDVTGEVLGSVIRDEKEGTTINDLRYRFEDGEGNRLGEIRAARPERPNTLEVFGPSQELRARITGVPSSSPGSYPVKVCAMTLQDVSGRTIVISEAFEHGREGSYEHVRMKGLKLKAQDGSVVVTLKKAMSSDVMQVELSSTCVDRLAVLALIVVLVS